MKHQCRCIFWSLSNWFTVCQTKTGALLYAWNSRWQGFQYRQKLKWIQVKMGHCLVPYICALQLPDKDICFLLGEASLNSALHCKSDSRPCRGELCFFNRRKRNWLDRPWWMLDFNTPTYQSHHLRCMPMSSEITVITLSRLPVLFTALYIMFNWVITTRQDFTSCLITFTCN